MAKCRYCSSMDLSDQNKWGECYCKRYGKYYDPDSSGCGHNDHESDGKETEGGCYLTTAMCEILGKPDDCYELETLRNFRENYMRNTEEGKKLLQEYDLISPPIVKKLLNRIDRNVIANIMLNDYINVAIEMILNKKYETAIEKYKSMVVYIRETLETS